MKTITKIPVIMTVFGIVLIVVGSFVCNYGQVDVDSFTAMNIAVSSRLGISFGFIRC